MKSAMLLLFVFMMSGAFAQDQNHNVESERYKINSANSLKADSLNGNLTFSGNVHFESDKLQLQADQIVIDQKTKTIVATGLKKMNFNGRVVFEGESAHQRLRYTLGKDDVFIE